MTDNKPPEQGGSTNPPPSPDDDRPGLGKYERGGALIVGLAGVGTGGVGVFLSDNQAGTTAILLLGAVFLLMGVQGTAIRSASRDNVEMERRAKAKVTREMVKEAEIALEQGETDRAEVLSEVAERFSSNAMQRLKLDIAASHYEIALKAAIEMYPQARGRAIGTLIGIHQYGMDAGVDGIYADSIYNLQFGVMAKYTQSQKRTLTSAVVNKAFDVQKRLGRPLLVVGSFPLSRAAQLMFDEYSDGQLFFAEWHPEGDTEQLYKTIDAIYAKAGK